MKRYLLMLIAAALLAACNQEFSAEQAASAADSISRVLTPLLVRDQIDSAMALVDSADAEGMLSPYNATMLRVRVMSRNEARVGEAQQLCEQLLEQDLSDKQRMAVLEMLLATTRTRRDDQHALEYGTQYIDLCRRLGEETRALTIQAEMGDVLIRLGRTEEGLSRISEAVAQLDTKRQFAEMDACILAMKSFIRSLITLDRYSEIPPVGERIIAKLEDFAAHPDEYADGSPRLPSEERRAGYVDFYTGQACAFTAYAYAMMAQMPEARAFSRRFDQTRYSRSYGGRKQMASAWRMIGEYDRMIAVYDEMEKALGADTVHHDYAVDLFNRAKAAEAMGQTARSADYWKRYAMLIKQINNSERVAMAEEYAARYHEQEQQYALEKEHADKEFNRLVAWSLYILLVVTVVFMIAVIFQLREVKRKNTILSEEIAGHVAFKDKYFRLKAQQEIPAEEKDKEVIPTLAAMTDTELFEFLRVVIVGEQLYANPQFGREHLMERFRLSKERVGSAFSRGSNYGSLPNYVSECRLSASVWLLREERDMTIAEIAEKCGYTNVGTFSTQFKKRFSISPSDFRKAEY